jgi:adenine-specific DNA glycosylase
VLVRQRPAGVVNAHLWEFPNVEVSSQDGGPRKAALTALGTVPERLKHFCTIRHSITRYRIRLDVFETAAKGGIGVLAGTGQWLRPSRLQELAFTGAHKKILHLLENSPTVIDGQ